MSIQMCRYMKRYERLVDFYKNNVIEGYVEKHHILPLCMGGNNDLENLVALPPRAHYLAHYFLWKAFPDNNKLAHAFAMMGVNNPYQHRVMNGKLYEISKIARSKALKGRRLTKEIKDKMRKPKKSNKNYFGNTNAKGNKGKKLPPRKEEHTKKLVESQRWYQEKRKQERENKALIYREEYTSSGLSRREFSKSKGVNYSTMKKYLQGLP